jgi:hypothetical protein
LAARRFEGVPILFRRTPVGEPTQAADAAKVAQRARDRRGAGGHSSNPHFAQEAEVIAQQPGDAGGIFQGVQDVIRAYEGLGLDGGR